MKPSRETVISNMRNELDNCETTLKILSAKGNKYVKPWMAKKLKDELQRVRMQIKQADAVGIL